ncbi:hypothetical protein [Flavobacterium okayamense]|uniref:Lipoprotein n=1 Tax=Flavobacterium okayamense TaxID=2830782 RepID=A0ABN6HTI9_9FLAO|nr:hypothetical protein [Flavobacterium okayamense]BCY27727.1 hypothetical protein KK2020170_05950 [Flavobacterium okayamense]
MKKYLFLLVLISLVYSCSKQKNNVEIKTKNLTIIINESTSLIEKKLNIEPTKDSIISSENFSISNVSDVLKTYYNANSKTDKITFTNASSNKYDIYVINHNKNEDFNNLIIEFCEVLKKKNLLEYKIEP